MMVVVFCLFVCFNLGWREANYIYIFFSSSHMRKGKLSHSFVFLITLRKRVKSVGNVTRSKKMGTYFFVIDGLQRVTDFNRDLLRL